MASALIGPFVVFACLVLIVVVARALAGRTAHLRLTYFQPWRGDPWPIGVQEDDDFRFTWTAPASAGASSGGPAVGPPPDAEHATPAAVETVDELPSGSIEVTPVGRIHVGRADDGRPRPS